MKSYPTIETNIDTGTEYHVFDKLDGSNIRAEWTLKSGFQRFGTRRQLLSETGPFAPAKAVILRKYGDELGEIFRGEGFSKVTCFFEYFGPNSFAGDHVDPTDRMDAVLFDVNPLRKGFLGPEAFLQQFGFLHVPNYLGKRVLDPAFVESVQNGQAEGVTFEGVVCKAIFKNRLKMLKIKNRAWLDRLRTECSSAEEFAHRS